MGNDIVLVTGGTGYIGKEEAFDYEKKEESLQETIKASLNRIPQAENFDLK